MSSENGHEVYTTHESLREVAKVLEAKFGEPRKAALTWKPQNTVPVDDEQGEKVLKLIDALNDHDDVQNVYRELRGVGRAGREDERVITRWIVGWAKGACSIGLDRPQLSRAVAGPMDR